MSRTVPVDDWFRVEVSDGEGQIVAIETELLAGRDIAEHEDATIRRAIRHLQGFVGAAPAEPNAAGQESTVMGKSSVQYGNAPVPAAPALAGLVKRLHMEASRQRSIHQISGADLIVWNRIMAEAATELERMAKVCEEAQERDVASLRRARAAERKLAEIESAPKPSERCEWKADEDGGWQSSCGEEWTLIDGTPKENGMKFCHGCGKPIEEVPYVDPLDAQR